MERTYAMEAVKGRIIFDKCSSLCNHVRKNFFVKIFLMWFLTRLAISSAPSWWSNSPSHPTIINRYATNFSDHFSNLESGLDDNFEEEGLYSWHAVRYKRSRKPF